MARAVRECVFDEPHRGELQRLELKRNRRTEAFYVCDLHWSTGTLADLWSRVTPRPGVTADRVFTLEEIKAQRRKRT